MKIKIDPTYGRELAKPAKEHFIWTSEKIDFMSSEDTAEKVQDAVQAIVERQVLKWKKAYNAEIQEFWKFISHGIKIDWQLRSGDLCVMLDGDDYEVYGDGEDIVYYKSIASVVVEKATAHCSPKAKTELLHEWKKFFENELRIIEEGLRE